MTLSIFVKAMLLSFFDPLLDQNLLYIGMTYTNASFTSAMCNTIPAFAFSMAWVFGFYARFNGFLHRLQCAQQMGSGGHGMAGTGGPQLPVFLAHHLQLLVMGLCMTILLTLSVKRSQKRFVAGDAFIFLRGENGELRVGVRRAMRQQSNVPSSVISSHSMHLGVYATAWHAILTKTMFTVYYKIFEGEEAPEQRFTGTIVGVEDADPNRWKTSKWRCLKVKKIQQEKKVEVLVDRLLGSHYDRSIKT